FDRTERAKEIRICRRSFREFFQGTSPRSRHAELYRFRQSKTLRVGKHMCQTWFAHEIPRYGLAMTNDELFCEPAGGGNTNLLAQNGPHRQRKPIPSSGSA